MKKILLIFGLAAIVVGCGEGTDPYHAISNSPTIPAISLPLEKTQIVNPVGISAARDRLDLTPTGASAYTFVAPIGGLVAAVDGSLNSYSVTIFHNPSFSVVVGNLSAVPAVRVGDVVTEGQALLSTAFSFGAVQFTVYHNGVAACPYPYLNSTSREYVRTNLYGGFAPCP